jgi:hypothetical protein
MSRIGLAALSTVFLSVPAAAQGPPAGLRVLDVPYVSQSEQLCGGAAAAMLMRHAGLRGVYAEDFSLLISEAAGGIAAGDLRRAIIERGFDVETWSGSPAIAQRHLTAGVPVMALIEDRPGRFHYVVLVAWTEGAVVYHDPARAPFLGVAESAFERAWAVAGRWMLVARATEAARRSVSGASAGVPTVTAGVHADVLREFQHRDYEAASRLAQRAVRANATDTEAWRLLAASLYLDGKPDVALDAWNRTGQPRVDLVRLEGLVKTPHRTVEGLMGIPAGSLLTRDLLVLGRRRLSMLPSADASRVSYVALPGGLAEVRGAVVEGPLVPSRVEWLAEGIRASVDREVRLRMPNLAGGGDRLALAWRFRELPRVRATFAFPTERTRGVWSLGASWQRETYAEEGPATTTRREATLGWTDWVDSRVRLFAEGGVARWDDAGTAGLALGGVQIAGLNERWTVSAGSTGAAGGPRFAAGTASARWRAPLSPLWSAAIEATVGHATGGAPPDAWFGAGTGQGRPLLLRAHPVLVDGRLAGPVFGRTIAHSTTEVRRELWARPLWAIGVAGFADAARAWRRADGSRSAVHVDVGVGLRIRLGGSRSVLRIDVARGVRDGKMAASAGVGIRDI